AVVGLRDRALIGVMVFTFARISAACGMNVADIFPQQRRLWVRLQMISHAVQQADARLHYSITSSARASRVGGIRRPSAVAVFTLRTSSSLVGCSTGRSLGLAPFKILSTYTPARRYISE